MNKRIFYEFYLRFYVSVSQQIRVGFENLIGVKSKHFGLQTDI